MALNSNGLPILFRITSVLEISEQISLTNEFWLYIEKKQQVLK